MLDAFVGRPVERRMMQLTEKNKEHIDSLSYGQLLSKWRPRADA